MTHLRIPGGLLKIHIPGSYPSPTESASELGWGERICILDVLGPRAQGDSASVSALGELPGQWRAETRWGAGGNREIARKGELWGHR